MQYIGKDHNVASDVLSRRTGGNVWWEARIAWDNCLKRMLN